MLYDPKWDRPRRRARRAKLQPLPLLPKGFGKALGLSALCLASFGAYSISLQNDIAKQSRTAATYIDQHPAQIYTSQAACEQKAPDAFKGACAEAFRMAEHLGYITDATKTARAPMAAVQISDDFKYAAPLYSYAPIIVGAYLRHDGARIKMPGV